MKTILTVLASLFLMATFATAAPAPYAKKPADSQPPAVKTGTYLMTWKGIDAPAYFHSDGFYACNWQGRWWHGQWRQDKGQLDVEEWPMDQPESRSRWKIDLKDMFNGKMLDGPAWKLRPMGAGGDT